MTAGYKKELERLPDEWRESAAAWVDSMLSGGKSEKTCFMYLVVVRLTMKDFEHLLSKPFLPEHLQEMTLDLAGRWEKLRISSGDSPSTINLRFGAWKSYIRFDAQQRGSNFPSFVLNRCLPIYDREKLHVPPAFARQAAARHGQLRGASETENWIDLRNQAMVNIAACGLKPWEISRIRRPNGSALDWSSLQIIDDEGGVREVQIPPQAFEIVDRYLELVPFDIDPGQALFVSRQGKAIRREAVRVAMQRITEMAGLPVALSSRAIRNGAAREMRQGGALVEDIASVLNISASSAAKIVEPVPETAPRHGKARGGGDEGFLKVARHLDAKDEKLIRRFMAHLALKTTHVDSTIYSYCRYARQYLQYCAQRGDGEQSILELRQEFLDSIRARYRVSTLSAIHAAMVQFGNWLVTDGVGQQLTALERPEAQSELETFKYMPMEQIDRMLTLLDCRSGTDPKMAMAAVMIALAGHYGVTQEELVDCRQSDFHFDADGSAIFKVPSGAIALDRATATRVSLLLSLIGPEGGAFAPVFGSTVRPGLAMSTRNMIILLRQVSLEVGCQPITHRTIRNSFIAYTLINTVDIIEASKKVRVRNIQRLLKIREIANSDGAMVAANDAGPAADWPAAS